ncbi:MAG: hypothetical protein GX780_08600 [Campylobacteraceae bacterium]|nr:hypothetical protein [Campylobacteraceae bacterium]
MIHKTINAFVFGLTLVLMIDFLLFIGLKLHYFDALNIKEYFNIYFFDNQPFIFVGVSSLVLGFAMLYSSFFRAVQGTYIFLLLASLGTLHPTVGYALGETIFLKPNTTFEVGSIIFEADLLYEGRYNYYVKREGIEKTIVLSKEDAKRH